MAGPGVAMATLCVRAAHAPRARPEANRQPAQALPWPLCELGPRARRVGESRPSCPWPRASKGPVSRAPLDTSRCPIPDCRHEPQEAAEVDGHLN